MARFTDTPSRRNLFFLIIKVWLFVQLAEFVTSSVGLYLVLATSAKRVCLIVNGRARLCVWSPHAEQPGSE